MLGEGLDQTNHGLGNDANWSRIKNNQIDSYAEPSDRDEIECKVPGTDVSERGDESENEVADALGSNEPAQTKHEVEFNDEDEDDDDEDEDEEADDNDTEDDESDASIRSRNPGSDKEEELGWKTVPQGRSSSPRDNLPMIQPVGGNEKYFPKDTPVEELDDGDPDTLLVVSAILPASRQAPYKKNRGLDDVAQEHGRGKLNRSRSPNSIKSLNLVAPDMSSVLGTGTAGESVT